MAEIQNFHTTGGQKTGGPPEAPPGCEFLVNVKLDHEERLVGSMPNELAAYLSPLDWDNFLFAFNAAVDERARFHYSYCYKMCTGDWNPRTLRRGAIPALLNVEPAINPTLKTKGLMVMYWFNCETETMRVGYLDRQHDRTFRDYTHYMRFLTIPAAAATSELDNVPEV